MVSPERSGYTFFEALLAPPEIGGVKIVISKFLNRKFKGVRWMPRLKMAMKDVA